MGIAPMTWLSWGIVTVWLSVILSVALSGDDKTVFLPGQTSHGHYQIEMACDACHKEPFGGKAVIQQACVDCHGQELKEAKDSHPKSKFTDPRNAARLAKLDALHCVTCHIEHRPEVTRKMGLTLPEDLCINCHADIAQDRPSHRGMEFSSCAGAGCHNYHDNRALYEDFLVRHVGESPVKETPRLDALRIAPKDPTGPPAKALDAGAQNAPPGRIVDDKILHQWAGTAHARSGVNCSDCHRPEAENGPKQPWRDRPGAEVCQTCHHIESEGFIGGRHGMRLKVGLSPMKPARARLPMRSEARRKSLTCVSCHGAHEFDVKAAALEACLGCHADKHSKHYLGSLHYRLWMEELAGKGGEGTGVSCATCHFPRERGRSDGAEIILAQHNQNRNLRPNEKMIRGVCLHCHGLAFSIDALADDRLIGSNFTGRPTEHVESVDMAAAREKSATKRQ